MSEQVRKEYGKCLRTHCCSGKSVDSSVASGKGAASRAPGRYSAGSQVALTLPIHSFYFQASSVSKMYSYCCKRGAAWRGIAHKFRFVYVCQKVCVCVQCVSRDPRLPSTVQAARYTIIEHHIHILKTLILSQWFNYK